jgi:hypothetical protein
MGSGGEFRSINDLVMVDCGRLFCDDRAACPRLFLSHFWSWKPQPGQQLNAGYCADFSILRGSTMMARVASTRTCCRHTGAPLRSSLSLEEVGNTNFVGRRSLTNDHLVTPET